MAHISGKTDRIFMKILTEMSYFHKKSSVELWKLSESALAEICVLRVLLSDFL